MSEEDIFIEHDLPIQQVSAGACSRMDEMVQSAVYENPGCGCIVALVSEPGRKYDESFVALGGRPIQLLGAMLAMVQILHMELTFITDNEVDDESPVDGVTLFGGAFLDAIQRVWRGANAKKAFYRALKRVVWNLIRKKVNLMANMAPIDVPDTSDQIPEVFHGLQHKLQSRQHKALKKGEEFRSVLSAYDAESGSFLFESTAIKVGSAMELVIAAAAALRDEVPIPLTAKEIDALIIRAWEGEPLRDLLR